MYTPSVDSPGLRLAWRRHRLQFAIEARTSRGRLPYKDTWYVKAWLDNSPHVRGLGEVAMFKGLSAEDDCGFEQLLDDFCKHPSGQALHQMPSSIRFGIETALSDLANGGKGTIVDVPWASQGVCIPINGLVWMSDIATMLKTVEQKIEAGFGCIKLKIGALDFEAEIALIATVRKRFSADVLQLRVDANGAFGGHDVFEKLEVLAQYGVHSIEQPVRAGQPCLMQRICARTPVPVALDEDLIGIRNDAQKQELLSFVRPQYIILKPSLCGGFEQADRWIDCAQGNNVGWWATSALESNVGLNAISAWVAAKNPQMCQGLGTGKVFDNNPAWHVVLDGTAVKYAAAADRQFFETLFA